MGARSATVCFHRRRRCGFCGIPRPQVARARLRCACCGRFVKAGTPDRCPVCTARSYVALTLAF